MSKLTTEEREALVEKYHKLGSDTELWDKLRAAGIYLALEFNVGDLVETYDLTEEEAHEVAEIAARKYDPIDGTSGWVEAAADRLDLELTYLDQEDEG